VAGTPGLIARKRETNLKLMELKNPQQLGEERMDLVHDLELMGYRLAEIKRQKSKLWPQYRQEAKSIVEADRRWEMSDPGLDEQEIRIRWKVTEHKINAIAGYLRILDGQARNQY
jgi:hypothetical protein